MSGGNPYHDGKGQFTTGGHDGSGNVNPGPAHGHITGATVRQAMSNIKHRAAVKKQMTTRPAIQNNRQIEALKSVPSARFTKGR